MLQLADLDTDEGTVKWAQLCSDHHACIPALRFFSIQIGDSIVLREALSRMRFVNDDSPSWALWALETFGDSMSPEFRRWLFDEHIELDEATQQRLLLAYPELFI
jgi:hypothetical protein